ncbi:HD domain-containing protein [Pseudonocardia nematodicida]|uniref:HD domain-containing protein n=1 Tax=Pseudonocardia nematodicida TaxID=1206997 RepID=A0ABV1KCF9_9PSEU
MTGSGSAGALRRLRDVVAADIAGADVAHDLGHLDRVAGLAGRLAVREGADGFVAAVAAYVHDHHRAAEARLGRVVAPAECRDTARDALRRAGIEPALWDPVLDAVEATGRYSFAADPGSGPGGGATGRAALIAACLHDADMLDAMGATGIARAFAYGGAIGEPLWDPAAPPVEGYRSGPTGSVVAHFHEKLLRLRGELATAAGRELGERRHAALEEFLRRFRDEWLETHDDPATAPPAP